MTATTKNTLYFGSLLFLAFALRLYGINAEGIWYDESASLRMSQESVTALFSDEAHDLSNPPFYYLLLKGWLHLWGSQSEMALRSLSLLFGVLGIAGLYLLAKQWFDLRTAQLSALILTLSPAHIYLSQEARSYTLAILLTIFSFYFYKRLRDQFSTGALLGHALSSTLLLYTHNFGLLALGVQVIDLLFFGRRAWQQRWKAITTFALIGLGYLPWLFALYGQIAGRFENPLIDYYVKANWWQHLIAFPYYMAMGRTLAWREDGALWFALGYGLTLVVLAFPIALGLRAGFRRHSLLLLWFGGVLILAVLLTLILVPLVHSLYVSILLPAFALLLALGFWEIKRRRLLYLIALAYAALLTISIVRIYSVQQREDWRSAAAFIDREVQAGEALLIFPDHFYYPYKYYSKASASVWAATFLQEGEELRENMHGTSIEPKLAALPGLWFVCLQDPYYAGRKWARQRAERYFSYREDFAFWKVEVTHYRK